MTRDESLLIIESEGLSGYSYGEQNVKGNEVGIQYINAEWNVYYTDGRASHNIIKVYETESEAVENVIECLRLSKSIYDRKKRIKAILD